jgi:hypothetical protein
MEVVLSILQQGLRHVLRFSARFLEQRGLESGDCLLEVHQLDDFGFGDPEGVGAHLRL